MKDLFFFFKQKTAYEIKECDWSSDVCSSDLTGAVSSVTASAAATAPVTGLAGTGAVGTLLAAGDRKSVV